MAKDIELIYLDTEYIILSTSDIERFDTMLASMRKHEFLELIQKKDLDFEWQTVRKRGKEK